VPRNADMLRANIEKCEHATTEALFAEAPGLCDYIWEGWEGIEHYQRSPLSLAVSYNDTWLVRFLITKTNCDAIFAEVPSHVFEFFIVLLCRTGSLSP